MATVASLGDIFEFVGLKEEQGSTSGLSLILKKKDDGRKITQPFAIFLFHCASQSMNDPFVRTLVQKCQEYMDASNGGCTLELKQQIARHFAEEAAYETRCMSHAASSLSTPETYDPVFAR